MKTQLHIMRDLSRGDADVKVGSMLVAWIRAKSTPEPGVAHMSGYMPGMLDHVGLSMATYRMIP